MCDILVMPNLFIEPLRAAQSGWLIGLYSSASRLVNRIGAFDLSLKVVFLFVRSNTTKNVSKNDFMFNPRPFPKGQ